MRRVRERTGSARLLRRMTVLGETALFVAVLASGARAQQADAGALEATVDSLVAAERGRRPVAGMVVAVVQGTDTLVMKAYGHADLEHRAPMTPDAVFRIASLTKQFTAAAVLRLVEDGRVSLDDPPGRRIPAFPDTSGAIRIRHLLNHTSGLPDIYEIDGWAELRPQRPSHDEARRLMTRLLTGPGLHFPPGRSYHYSNAGYDFLGSVVEAASGESYGAFLDRSFFDPLELPATSFCTYDELIPDRAMGYDVEDGEFVNAFRHSPYYLFASGGLCSTARDLIRWSKALHSGAVLSAESYHGMTTPGGGTSSYGYGIGVSDLAGHRKLNHNGSLPGFSAQLDHYPDDDLVVVVLANSPAAVGMLADGVARATLGLPPRPLPKPPEGWRVIARGGAAARDSINFRTMMAGVHSTADAAAVYFHPDSVGRAPYEAGATFNQIGEPATDEGVGLMLAATETASDAPAHLLFRVRKDGAWAVHLRRGLETVRTLRPWTRHEAVVTMSGGGGRNELRVVAGPEALSFTVNGIEVGTVRADEVGSTDGVAGLFVGRGHDVHIDGFHVGPPAEASASTSGR